MDIRGFYEENKHFREYVDRYAKSRCISLETALEHALIKEYYLYIRGKE